MIIESVQQERRKDREKLKKRKENDAPPSAMMQGQEPAKKRSKLVLPAPQISENELEQVVKIGRASEAAKELAAGVVAGDEDEENADKGPKATDALLGDYSLTPGGIPNAGLLRTPRTPAAVVDKVLQVGSQLFSEEISNDVLRTNRIHEIIILNRNSFSRVPVSKESGIAQSPES